jgi:hypothetical protein
MPAARRLLPRRPEARIFFSVLSLRAGLLAGAQATVAHLYFSPHLIRNAGRI